MFDEALRTATRLEAIRGQEARSLFVRGLVVQRKGDPSKAAMLYSKAISIDAQFAQAVYYRGRAMSELGSVGLALRDFHAACSLGFQTACEAVSVNDLQMDIVAQSDRGPGCEERS